MTMFTSTIKYNEDGRLKSFDKVLTNMEENIQIEGLMLSGQVSAEVYNVAYADYDWREEVTEADKKKEIYDKALNDFMSDETTEYCSREFYKQFGGENTGALHGFDTLNELYIKRGRSMTDAELKTYVSRDFDDKMLEQVYDFLNHSVEKYKPVLQSKRDWKNTTGRLIAFYKNNGETLENVKFESNDDFVMHQNYSQHGDVNKNIVGMGYIGEADYQDSKKFMNAIVTTLTTTAVGKVPELNKLAENLLKEIDGLESLMNTMVSYGANNEDLIQCFDNISDEADKILNDEKYNISDINLSGLHGDEKKVVEAISNLSVIGGLLGSNPYAALGCFALSLGSATLSEVKSRINGEVAYQHFVNSNGDLSTGLAEISGDLPNTEIEYNMSDYGLHKVKADGLKNTITGTDAEDYIESLYGTNNELTGLGGNDTLVGSDNKDSIQGGNDNDVLIGNGGYDTLIGGHGNDTFIYSKGDGKDTIKENGNTAHLTYGNDTLVLKDLELENVNIYREGNNLIVESKHNSEDRIVIDDQFNTQNPFRSVIDNIQFAEQNAVKVNDFFFNNNDVDITKHGSASIQNLMYGNGGNDTLYGKEKNDILYGDDYKNELIGIDYLYGNDGNDTLYGGKGNDMLFGGDHNDTLYGGDDNDRLYGGTGEDKLYGQKGNDTYVVRAGDGVTRIVDEFGNDTLDLSDFEFEDVKIYRDMLNPSILRIKSNDMSDGNAVDITIKNYFDSEGNFSGKSIDLVKFKNQEPSNLFTNYKFKASENEIVDFTTTGEKDFFVINGMSDVGNSSLKESQDILSADTSQEYMSYIRDGVDLIVKSHDSNWKLLKSQKLEDFFTETNDVYRPNNDNKHFISFTNKKM